MAKAKLSRVFEEDENKSIPEEKATGETMEEPKLPVEYPVISNHIANQKDELIVVANNDFLKPSVGLTVKLYNNDKKYLPKKATEQSSCDDIKARITPGDKITNYRIKNGLLGSFAEANILIHTDREEPYIKLLPGDRCKIPTGLFFDIPNGLEVIVRPRSGLSLNHGILLVNTPATIDSDYTGEVHVIIQNIGEDTFVISDGMKIAQLTVALSFDKQYNIVDEINKTTKRGNNGFGHSGI